MHIAHYVLTKNQLVVCFLINSGEHYQHYLTKFSLDNAEVNGNTALDFIAGSSVQTCFTKLYNAPEVSHGMSASNLYEKMRMKEMYFSMLGYRLALWKQVVSSNKEKFLQATRRGWGSLPEASLHDRRWFARHVLVAHRLVPMSFALRILKRLLVVRFNLKVKLIFCSKFKYLGSPWWFSWNTKRWGLTMKRLLGPFVV